MTITTSDDELSIGSLSRFSAIFTIWFSGLVAGQ